MAYQIDETLIKALSERQFARIRNEKIGMVMQDFALVEDFTTLDNVLLPLEFAKHKKAGRMQQRAIVAEGKNKDENDHDDPK